MAADASKVVRFGVFEADLGARELRKRGVRQKLQDQPFRVLEALLEKPGEIVTREELKDRLWAQDEFVEFDKSLNTAVQKIRQALDDSAASPRFLETIPKVGYRFLATVETSREAPDSKPAAASRVRQALAVAAVLALAAAAYFAGRAGGPEPRSVAALSTPAPITTYPGRETLPDFSPDGDQITFTWNGPDQDNYDIYVKRIGEEDAERLTDYAGDDYNSVWSHDGRRIAFIRRIEAEAGAVMVVPAVGGPPRQVVAIPSGLKRGIVSSRYLTWHPDGRHLIIAMPEAEGGPLELHVVDVETSESRKLLAAESLVGDTDPALSPDGTGLAFTRRLVGFHTEIDIVELTPSLVATGKPRSVVGKRLAGLPTWTPDGRELVFRISWVDGAGLWRTNLDGEAQLLLARASSPALSQTGRLAMTLSSGDYDTWEFDIAAGSSRPIAQSTSHDVTPQYSPDGAKIAFSSSRSGFREIWLCNRDGTNPTRLTHLEARMSSGPYWSPDSSWITFQTYFEDDGEIYVVRSSGGEPVNLTNHPADDRQPTVSRDGRWIYFSSDRSGEYCIWKIGPDGGSPLQVTTGERQEYALESVDGRTLFYSDGSRLWSMPVAGGSPTVVLEQFPVTINWVVSEEGVYFQRALAAKNVIQFFDFRSRIAKPVLQAAKASYFGLSLSPEGQSILYTLGDPPESDIFLVDNFR